MKNLFLLLLVAVGSPAFASGMMAPKARPTSCTVKTFDHNGHYLATVQTGDGVALDLEEAANLAALLNERHHNGANPVRAIYNCS